MTIYLSRRAPVALLACAVIGSPAAAQEENSEKRRTRIGVGAQVVPSYPGADAFSVRPLVDIARARGDTPFEFEAPDESFDIALLNRGGFAMGPALGFEGSRKASDIAAPLPKVGFTLEAGMFMQYALSKTVRLRAEVRKGIGGHEGLIANLSADFIKRKNDDWLFSIGPRVTIADRKYHRAYYSVTPADGAPSGLPAYSAGAGIQAVGATAGYLAQLTRRWGVYSYLKYDRLVADAAGSPIVRRHGSRDQWSGGLALTYTFGAD